MRSISIGEIVEIHGRIVGQIGGSTGIREPGLLAAIAEKPQASFGGKDLYPTIFDKSATLFEALCNYHAFVDGNKRTAIVTLEYFLSKNGFRLAANQTKKEQFILDTAAGNPDLSKVARWIKQHAKRAAK